MDKETKRTVAIVGVGVGSLIILSCLPGVLVKWGLVGGAAYGVYRGAKYLMNQR